MPTTFTVFSLGNFADIDPIEGNNRAEDADLLEGLTFGGVGDALLNAAVIMQPGSTGFGAGNGTAYDQNNAGDTFSTDGGVTDQVFDAVTSYFATITYIDGTTASISAVVFQDTAGNTYLAPEQTGNADQTALEFAAIRSITLDRVQTDTASGLGADREAWNFVTCYVAGTMIMTETGERPIDRLVVGDLVETRDRGLQPIRWIGMSQVIGTGKLAPVRFVAGALGPNTPARDLLVSRQHRMLVSSRVCERMFGSTEILVPAIRLTDLAGVYVEETAEPVTYYHMMTDHHDIIYAEGTPSETLLTGPQAIEALPEEALDELLAIFPNILQEIPEPARQIERGKRIDQLIRRHQRNAVPFVGTVG